MPNASIENSNPANERVWVLVRALSCTWLQSQMLVTTNNKCHKIVSEDWNEHIGKSTFQLPLQLQLHCTESRQSSTKAPGKSKILNYSEAHCQGSSLQSDVNNFQRNKSDLKEALHHLMPSVWMHQGGWFRTGPHPSGGHICNTNHMFTPRNLPLQIIETPRTLTTIHNKNDVSTVDLYLSRACKVLQQSVK